MSSFERLHVVVEGRVQGVGFRAWTAATASARALCGWVQNREDGGVEIWCEGTSEVVEAFYRELFLGPSHAKVDALTVLARHSVARVEGQGFEIRR